MTNFNLIDIFVKVFDDLFSYVDINHKFMCEVPESSLNSTEEVNTLVGISGDMEGSINAIRLESMYNVSDKVKDYVLLTTQPTYIAGGDMYGLISKVPTKKLFFKVNGEKFGIAYSLEQK